MERTRADTPEGISDNASPIRTTPECAVPVTMVPSPCSVKARSTARRNIPSADRSSNSEALILRCSRSSEIPSPLTDDTGNRGQCSAGWPATIDAIAAIVWSPSAESTRSIFVTTTAPCWTPSSRRISRCSLVCGIGPSSAAITSKA